MLHSVSTLDIPELQAYRTLRRPLEHKEQGFFVAEGEKVVRRLLSSGLKITSMLMTPEWWSRLESFGVSDRDDLPVYLAEQKLLETIVGFRLHQGIMAIGRIPKERELKEVQFAHPIFLVALDRVLNPENVGVIVRNAAAFGAQAILASPDSSSPYLRRAVRSSMGAVFHLPVFSVDLRVEFPILKQQGIELIAADPSGNTRIEQLDCAQNICVLLGSEGEGISPDLLNLCSHRVAIPMQHQMTSINVSSAAAIFFYEVWRGRLAGD